MKKLLPFIILAFSNNVMADWTGVGGEVDPNSKVPYTTTYVNLDSIQKSGNIVKMTNLNDLRFAEQTETGKSYYSAKMLLEYDCKEAAYRNISATYYSENMGNGKILLVSNKQEEWHLVDRSGILNTLWKVACGEK